MFEIAKLNERSNSFLAIPAATEAAKIATTNAIMNPIKGVADIIGEDITIMNVFMEEISIHNNNDDKSFDDDGVILDEMTAVIRTIIINDKGEGFSSVSESIPRALSTIFANFGTPDMWEGRGLTVKVGQRAVKGTNRVFTLTVKCFKDLAKK